MAVVRPVAMPSHGVVSAALSLAAVLLVLVVQRPLPADGDETLGAPSISIADGSRILAAGVGLSTLEPGTIRIDVPEHMAVLQVLLYWGLRSEVGDDDVVLDGSIDVTGQLIGRSACTGISSSRAWVYRADITSLDLVGSGSNEVTVDGVVADGLRPNGASIVVIADDGSDSEIMLIDGSDFALGRYREPCNATVRQSLASSSPDLKRKFDLILIVGDVVATSQGALPTVVEVEFGGEVQELNNILVGADGPEWDTLALPVTVPPGPEAVDVQIFSEDRLGVGGVPASLYWIVAGLTVSTVGEFRRCDSNNDGQVNLADPVWLVLELLQGGPTTACYDAADCNKDGRKDLSDAIFAVNYLFRGGTRPPPPFADCGIDPDSTPESCPVDSTGCS